MKNIILIFCLIYLTLTSLKLSADTPPIPDGGEYIELTPKFGFLVTVKKYPTKYTEKREELPDGSTRFQLTTGTKGLVTGYFIMKVGDDWLPVEINQKPLVHLIDKQ